MDAKVVEELRQKYINNPPDGMTAKLVQNMINSVRAFFVQEFARNTYTILPA